MPLSYASIKGSTFSCIESDCERLLVHCFTNAPLSLAQLCSRCCDLIFCVTARYILSVVGVEGAAFLIMKMATRSVTVPRLRLVQHVGGSLVALWLREDKPR